MKQKYAITKDENSGQMTIQEFAELDKDAFSLVCEETYNTEKTKAALARGKEPLIDFLRTPNLYPVSEYADKIADSVSTLFNQADQNAVEIEFDDIEALKDEKAGAESESPDGTDGSDESVAIDDLLSEDPDEEEEDEGVEPKEKQAKDETESGVDDSLGEEDPLDVFDEDEEEDKNS